MTFKFDKITKKLTLLSVLLMSIVLVWPVVVGPISSLVAVLNAYWSWFAFEFLTFVIVLVLFAALEWQFIENVTLVHSALVVATSMFCLGWIAHLLVGPMIIIVSLTAVCGAIRWLVKSVQARRLDDVFEWTMD